MQWQEIATDRVPLAPLTSLRCGGPAQHLFDIDGTEGLQRVLGTAPPPPYWLLGYGSNVLVSDAGLEGSVLLMRGGEIGFDPDNATLIAEAGVWWDEVVETAVSHGYWGAELMSGIPGNVGAAVAGNIAAYGQAVADTLTWVDVCDPKTGQVHRLPAHELKLGYRSSAFQDGELQGLIIVRAAWALAERPTTELGYQSALDVADELELDPCELANRRRIILETRSRAGSLYDSGSCDRHHSAGSFFKNPLVTPEQAGHVAGFDESGRSREQLAVQNRIHGGDSTRVSAALVLLAAGFERGQEFGPVRLHPRHVLKIENRGDARAQDVYEVARSIMDTVRERMGIELEPEVKFLGEF